MKRFFFAAFCILVFSTGTIAQQQTINQVRKEIVVLVNNHRKSKNLPPLEPNDLLRKEAQKHSLNMARGYVPFSHKGFDQRFNRLSGFLDITSGAENIANGPLNAKTIVNGWLMSPKHRDNIEGNFNLIGVGIVPAPNGTYFYTQIFAKSAERPKIIIDEFEGELLQMINKHRKDLGLASLKLETEICKQARGYSGQMASGKVPIGPPGFDNPVKSLMQTFNASSMVELIAYDYYSPKDVFDSWMASTQQRETIEGNYALTGIGVVQSSDGKVFVTQIFLRK